MSEDFYVYAYIRDNDDSWGYVGTPYYIGKGRGNRKETPRKQRSGYGTREIKPKNKEQIIILKSGLTEQEAHILEEKLIYFYGRINTVNGCLMNLTDGGEGLSGYVYSDALRETRRQQLMGNNYGSKVDWSDPAIKEAHSRGLRNIIYVKTAARRRQDEKLKIIYKWKRIQDGEIDELCCIDMARRHGGTHKSYWFAANGKTKTALGWICLNPSQAFIPKVVDTGEVAKKSARTRNSKGAAELGITIEEYEKMNYSARYKAKQRKKREEGIKGIRED
jgi:hypothetical protein